MAVMDNLTARLTPQGRGHAEVALMSFAAGKIIPNYRNEIELLFVKRGSEERLGDWPSEGTDPMGFVRIKPIAPQQKGMDFIFGIDGAIVDALAYDPNKNFMLKLRGADEVIRSFNVDVQRKNGRGLEANLARVDPKPQAQGSGTAGAAAGFAATPGAAPQGLGAPLGPGGAPTAASAKSGSLGLGKILGLIFFLILLGVGGFFLLRMLGMFGGGAASVPEEPAAQEEPTPEPEPEPEPAAEPEPVVDNGLVSANAACRLDGTSGDERDVLSMCLATKPSKEDLTGMLAEALRLERCEIAQRILRTLGRAPDGTAYAFVYATFADPNSAMSNKCIAKRPSDAQYWGTRVKNDHGFNQADGIALLEQLTGQKYQAPSDASSAAPSAAGSAAGQ